MKRVWILLLTLTLTACITGLTVKQKAHLVRMTVHESLVAADDFEVSLCKPLAPPNSNQCGANPRVIQDAQHQAYSRALSKLYDLDIRAGNAILAYQPGQPAPTEIAQLRQAATDLLTSASAFGLTGNAAKVVTYAQGVLNAVNQLAAAFGRLEQMFLQHAGHETIDQALDDLHALYPEGVR